MGVAMLFLTLAATLGLQHLMHKGRRKIAFGLVLLLAFEYLALPLGTSPTIPPPQLSQLAETGGRVLHIPLNAGDVFHQGGRLNFYSMIYQMGHGQPRVGGFVSRRGAVPLQALREQPLFSSLLQLGEGEKLSPGQESRDLLHGEEALVEAGVNHIVVLPEAIDGEEHQYLRRLFPDLDWRPLSDGGSWATVSPRTAIPAPGSSKRG